MIKRLDFRSRLERLRSQLGIAEDEGDEDFDFKSAAADTEPDPWAFIVEPLTRGDRMLRVLYHGVCVGTHARSGTPNQMKWSFEGDERDIRAMDARYPYDPVQDPVVWDWLDRWEDQ
jgi:hypothetical protein